MTTRDGLGEASDHSLSMAMTAGSALSATAGPPANSNATSTIAKRRTPTSPDETPQRMYKAASPRQGALGRKVQVRVSFWESVTYLPAPPTRMRIAPAQMMEVTALFGRDARGWSAGWTRDGSGGKAQSKSITSALPFWADIASLPPTFVQCQRPT